MSAARNGAGELSQHDLAVALRRSGDHDLATLVDTESDPERLRELTAEAQVALAEDRRTLRRLDVREMVRERPPPVPWTVRDLVVEGSLTLVSGREGEGKSLLAGSLAAGVAAGETIAGLDCQKGAALIVDAENGAFEIHRRVHTLGLPSEGVGVYEAEGFHLGRDLAELASLLRELCPSLVVLDSLRSLWPGGDENDPAAVAAVLDPLRNLAPRGRRGCSSTTCPRRRATIAGAPRSAPQWSWASSSTAPRVIQNTSTGDG